MISASELSFQPEGKWRSDSAAADAWQASPQPSTDRQWINSVLCYQHTWEIPVILCINSNNHKTLLSTKPGEILWDQQPLQRPAPLYSEQKITKHRTKYVRVNNLTSEVKNIKTVKSNSWQTNWNGKKKVQKQIASIRERLKDKWKSKYGNNTRFSYQQHFVKYLGEEESLVLLPYGILSQVSYACSKLKTTTC